MTRALFCGFSCLSLTARVVHMRKLLSVISHALLLLFIASNYRDTRRFAPSVARAKVKRRLGKIKLYTGFSKH